MARRSGSVRAVTLFQFRIVFHPITHRNWILIFFIAEQNTNNSSVLGNPTRQVSICDRVFACNSTPVESNSRLIAIESPQHYHRTGSPVNKTLQLLIQIISCIWLPSCRFNYLPSNSAHFCRAQRNFPSTHRAAISCAHSRQLIYATSFDCDKCYKVRTFDSGKRRRNERRTAAAISRLSSDNFRLWFAW